MPYLLQAEDREVSFDLFQKLAEIMDESPDVVLADATLQLHHACGILEVADPAEAARLSTRFAEVGFPTSWWRSSSTSPLPSRSSLQEPKVEGTVEVVTVGHVEAVTEEHHLQFNPLNARMVALPFVGAFPIDSGVDEFTVEHCDDHCYLDLLTRTHHYRGHVPQARTPSSTSSLPATSPTSPSAPPSARCSAGNLNITRFHNEKDYDRHVSWLYQVRFNRPTRRLRLAAFALLTALAGRAILPCING